MVRHRGWSHFANRLEYLSSGRVSIGEHVVFPQANYNPAFASQRFRDLLIPGHVALDFGHPPLCPAREELSQILPSTPPDFFRVAMPHIAIYEYGQASRPDD